MQTLGIIITVIGFGVAALFATLAEYTTDNQPPTTEKEDQ